MEFLRQDTRNVNLKFFAIISCSLFFAETAKGQSYEIKIAVKLQKRRL